MDVDEGSGYIDFEEAYTISIQGHPVDRLGKLSVRKVLNHLQFSEGNLPLELS